MQHHLQHDHATSNVLAWSAYSANVEFAAEEEGAMEADEPPEPQRRRTESMSQFRRTSVIRRGIEHPESLLTKALQSHSEDDHADITSGSANPRRRRSMTSNISLASTAELTTDTGITTPARTSSPSPHLPQVGFAPFVTGKHDTNKSEVTKSVSKTVTAPTQPPSEQAKAGESRKDPAVQALEKKRCISFACAAKPSNNVAPIIPPQRKLDAAAEKPTPQVPKRTCIKFACPPKPAATAAPKHENAPAQKHVLADQQVVEKDLSPSTARKYRSPSAGVARSNRSSAPRRSSQSPVAVRSKKYITADSKELEGGMCRFHEFASDEPQEDDWILQEKTAPKGKLTIDDTLEKENAIRRLAKEAEEEAEQEEEEAQEDEDGETRDDELDAEDDNDLEDEEAEIEDDQSGYGSDDDASDGYNTDTEIGFADSDDEDEDDNLVLWTTGGVSLLGLSDATPIVRRSSFTADHSDSSEYSAKHQARAGKSRHRELAERLAFRSRTPELPDSTDFVCGTLDEDRPLEEAYMSHIAARKRGKLHVIPQDIDPSFPTSEPEDDEGEGHNGTHASDDHVWIHGELELGTDLDRVDRRKKKGDRYSPKRYHSPPPKRHTSPAPRARGRSPRRLFDRQSPKRTKSPAPPRMVTSPTASPVQIGDGVPFKSLAARPGLTHTKSLPRAPALFTHMKSNRRGKGGPFNKNRHIRGAIDIVKGLEQKRQRRKEKFYQKYCSRARKGQGQEKKPQPGQGAERMRELGLLMAGKILPGNYVLSV
ncbi:DUF2457 domain-containing protein [Pleurostoma richardsiae]|uniref:DUF2457 domain-containing protein n=1 Tax=Pleurostoma richardsiae TaxID=41990 RepID=A0AA38RUM0_9PEZI|nr:DUF2457 domain-containing protein [Pleurostoma richardsiae]